MTRIITYIILIILLIWLVDTIAKGIKGYFKFQVDKATDHMRKPQKLSRKRQISRYLAILLMIGGGVGFVIFLYFYFTGNEAVPFKEGIFASVIIFIASYIWYSDKLQPGK